MSKLECTIEKQVREWVEGEGGIWIKLLADGRKGIPDNLILMPPITIERNKYPVHLLVELKRKRGGVLSPHQERWLCDLTSITQPAFVCYSLEHVQDVVEHHISSLRRRILGHQADLI